MRRDPLHVAEPELEPLLADSTPCLAVVWLGGLVLAFLGGILVGLAWGRVGS